MTYSALEASVEDGQPIELFHFSNTEETFNYTNGQFETVFNSETYTPLAISRNDPDLQDVTSKRSLKVTVPADNDFVQRYVSIVPATIDQFKLFRRHTTDGGTPETVSYFSGQVLSVAFRDKVAEISIENFGTILDRLVPQQTSRNPCNHILYDSKCAVTDTSFAITGVVTAISGDGLKVTLSTGSNTVPDTGLELTAQLVADATFFNGGFLSRSNIELRMVRLVVDDTANVATLTVLFPFQTILVGTALVMFAGCAHTLAVCTDKFVNSDRYGGFPFIPEKNPFTIGVK